MNWVITLVSEIVIAVILFIVGMICKKTQKEFHDYKIVMAEKSRTDLVQTIQEEIQPIVEEIHRLQKRIDEVEDKESDDIGLILESYKFRYISLCRRHLAKGYLTETEFEQMTEMFKVYAGLGGNGQAAEYHHRVMQLPIQKDQAKAE